MSDLIGLIMILLGVALAALVSQRSSEISRKLSSEPERPTFTFMQRLDHRLYDRGLFIDQREKAILLADAGKTCKGQPDKYEFMINHVVEAAYKKGV